MCVCVCVCVCVRSFSLAVVSRSSLLGPVGALLQHQHSLPVLLKSHCVRFNILKDETKGCGIGPAAFIQCTFSNGPVRLTLRMRMKSCLSTRRKWQLSSLKMMVAARGASFSSASCPKSSPSCSVVTRPCVHTAPSASHPTHIHFQTNNRAVDR